MSARTDLAAALVDLLPGFHVQGYYAVPVEIDSIASGGKPWLMLWRGTVSPGQALGWRRHEFVVWLFVPQVDPATVDDALDDYLAVVLDGLDRSPRLGWTTAERGALAEGYEGYRITLTFHTDKTGS